MGNIEAKTQGGKKRTVRHAKPENTSDRSEIYITIDNGYCFAIGLLLDAIL